MHAEKVSLMLELQEAEATNAEFMKQGIRHTKDTPLLVRNIHSRDISR